MFVGMSIIHDHNKCHTTPWNYSALIVLTTTEKNYIQNAHAHSVLHIIYINTYINKYSVVQHFHLRFSQSFVGKKSTQFKAENQLVNSNIFYDATHTHISLPQMGIHIMRA